MQSTLAILRRNCETLALLVFASKSVRKHLKNLSGLKELVPWANRWKTTCTCEVHSPGCPRLINHLQSLLDGPHRDAKCATKTPIMFITSIHRPSLPNNRIFCIWWPLTVFQGLELEFLAKGWSLRACIWASALKLQQWTLPFQSSNNLTTSMQSCTNPTITIFSTPRDLQVAPAPGHFPAGHARAWGDIVQRR